MKDIEPLTKQIRDEELANYKEFFIDDTVFKSTINEIINSHYPGLEKFRALSKLAFIILLDKKTIDLSKNETIIIPTRLQLDFQKYIYSCSRFYAKSVPFFEWEDIYNEAVNILTTLINENNLENFENDERYKKFTETRRQRQLNLMDKYDSLYEYST